VRGPQAALGSDGNSYVPGGTPLPYTLDFSMPDGAPAGQLRVLTQLDASLDARAFRLGDLKLGDINVHLPAGKASFQGDFDFSGSKGFVLRVSAGIDVATRTATWLLQAIDPQTGEVLHHATRGLLAAATGEPSDSRAPQRASLSYSVSAHDGALSGVDIATSARLFIDQAPPIDSAPSVVKLDADAPRTTLAVSVLGDNALGAPTFDVRWQAADTLMTSIAPSTAGAEFAGGGGTSGVKSVTLYVAEDGSDFRIWQRQVEPTIGQAIFTGSAGKRYEFLAVATDRAGNREAASVARAVLPDDGARQEVLDAIGVNESLQTTPELPLATADRSYPANALFAEASRLLPGQVASSQSSDLRSVLAPFSLRGFAGGYTASDADIGAQALLELPDHSFLASAGRERNQVFHLGRNGEAGTAAAATEATYATTAASNADTNPRLTPLFTLDAPILDMAVDRLGQLWLTTGAELLQVDLASGQVIERHSGPGGDPLTHALAIDPGSGRIYVSSGNGIEIFDPGESDRSRAWRHFSNQRVGDLAFAADGRLWAVKWSGGEITAAQLQASSEIVSFPLDGRSAGRAELEYRLAGVVDSIAFGAAGTALDGLLFASNKLRQRAVAAGAASNTETTSRPQQSPLWMIELDSRRALQVASGGSRGASVVATADGRILIAQTTRIDEISRYRAPLVQAITVPDGALLPLPLKQIGVVFDQAMWLGAMADGSAAAADARSVLNPANFTLSALSAPGSSAGSSIHPDTVRWEASSRTAWLEVSGLSAGEYQIDIAASLQSASETPLASGYASRFTALADMSSRLQLDFSNTRANRASGEISYEVSVTNVGNDEIRGPLLLLLDAGRYFTEAIAGAQAAAEAPSEQSGHGQQHSELWTIDLSAALQALGGRLAVGASIAGQTVRVTPASELAPRAGLVELLKGNFGHGVYAFPQENLPPTLAVADELDGERLTPASVGEEWSATLEAIDADGTRFWWQLVEAPVGVTLTPVAELTSSEQGSHAIATLRWTPPASADASTRLVVRVEDGRGGVALREFLLPVIGGNRAPVIEGAYDLSIAEGESLSLPLLAADADGDRVTLAMRNLPYGAVFDAASSVLSWTPGYDQAGVWEAVTVIASDGKTRSSSTFTITVDQAYAQPVLAAVAAQSLREGEAWALQLAASVPGMIAGQAQADGTTLSLEYGARWLPGGATLDAQSGRFAWTPGFDQHGTYRVPISVVATWTSPSGQTKRSVVGRELVLNVANANGAPVFAAPETWRVLEGQPLRISVFAFDPDNPAFEPRLRMRPGSEAIGPEIGPESAAPTISYQLSGLPAGAIFDAETMEILWTPNDTQAGTYSVVVTATDDGDGTGMPALSQMTLPIVVSNANRAPQIGDLGNAFVDAGSVLEIPFSVRDLDGNPIAISISGLPRFASYTQLPPAATGPDDDPSAAQLRGSIRFAPGAGDRGDYTLTITASDDGDGRATEVLSEARSFVLSVRSLSEAPRIAAPQQVVALVGQPLSVAIIASDLDQDPLTWTSTGLPLGAELIPASQYGLATLRWTPSADDLGSRDIELIVTDSGLPPQDGGFGNPEQPLPNVSRHPLRILVRAENAAPELLGVLVNGQPLADSSSASGDASALQINAREGQALALEVFAQDSDADALHWRVAGLPRGMRFSADGPRAAFDWTPDLFAAQDGSDPDPGAVRPGHWRFNVSANDGMATLSRDIEIVVANANQAPRILPMPLQLINEGETLAFTVVAADADRDAVQLSLVHDQETPPGVSFNASNGRFEWTPENVVDNSSGDSRSYTLNFRANDGRGADNSISTQSVQLRVFDVNRRPQISVGNHAVLIGDTLSLPVVFGSASDGISLSDPDGATQSAALAISFSGLPEGAHYDADSQRLIWTPGAGQVGDFVVGATVSDGQARNRTASAVFTLRVVAEATANAPKILVSTTPATPALPGQTILASVRADAWSGIAQLAVAVRGPAVDSGSDPANWQSVALDSAGRIRLRASQPGLIEIRVIATDRDGFSASHSQTLRIKDPADTAAPQLAWSGAMSAASADAVPYELRASTALSANIVETQLMGWQLQIAALGSNRWQTLAEAETPAISVAQTLSLATLDPQKLDNGLYQLRLTAWDLAGRSSEIASRLIIDSAHKTFTSHSQADATLTLAGHSLAFARHWREPPRDGTPADKRGDFGNWTLPLLASQLSSDQPTSLANGAIAPWSLGARVWLSIPADRADADAGLAQLSFTLGAKNERLGDEAGAPQAWRPSFSSDRGWTLQAHADLEHSGADNLQRQGDRLYERDSGLPWVPSAYTLTAPDGTRYMLDAQGTIERISFTDGQAWLLSDAGIVAVNGTFEERVDLQRDSAGRIVRLTAPDGSGGTTAIVYRYDSAGRLILVRHLDDDDLGTPIAYGAAGQLLTDRLTANLGAIVNWADSSTWAGELRADQVVSLAFSVRESEIASTIHTPGAQGAVILALETRLPADSQLEVVGAQMLGSSTANGKVTQLLRVGEAGSKLIRLSGSGAAQLRLSVAGDLDRDGRVDAADSQAWEQAAATQDPLGDIDGDGRIGSADRQLLVANSGFKANQAPTASNTANGAPTTPTTPITPNTLKTHTGLSTRGALSDIAEDLEGDALFWRILGSTHGSARLEASGQEVSFTPEAGYSGVATLTLQADDGFAAGAPIELSINISDARLLQLHLAPLPALLSGQFARLQAIADFTDERAVAITDPAYLTLRATDLTHLGGSSPPPLRVDDAHDLIHATGIGPALLILERIDVDGRLIQAAAAINVGAAAQLFDPDSENETAYADEETLPIEPDVYPGTLTLMPGDTRQLKVHLLEPGSEQRIDIHTPRQTNFAGTPETLETYLDAETGESFDILMPATPPVFSGTRYIVADASIASLSEDGLITALQPGEVTVSIIHLASAVDPYGGISEQRIGQTDIRLRVQAAALTDDDPSTDAPAGIAIAADQGGVVQAASGETVLIGAGALRDDTLVSIQRIDVAELLAKTGMAAPEPELLQTLAAFRLELGEQASSVPVQLAIPLQDDSGVEAGDEVLFLRRGTAPDVTGALQDKWWLLDNGFVGTDAQGRLVARTASPPYNGVSASGDLILVKTRTDHQTGAVSVRGNGLNVFALTTNSLAISMAGNLANGGLAGAGAANDLIGLFAGMSEIYAINLDFGGVYQVVPVQKNIDDGELTLSIAPPAASGSGTLDTSSSPRISELKMLASGKLQLTLEGLQAQAAPGMAAQPTALRLWVSPNPLRIDAQGKARSKDWHDDSQTRHEGMRLWQKLVDLAAVTPGASRMTVEVELPPQLALGLHVLTVQRMLQTVDRSNPGASRWLANGEPGSVTLEGQSDFSVVTLANKIQIFRDGQIVNELPYLDANGNPVVGGGSKTDQMAFSLDNRLLFVAGARGNIHVIDTATMRPATSFSVGTANISSLAVSGQSLYVAEGGQYAPTGSYRLLRVNIDETSADFLASQQIDLPASVSGQNAPYGYIDLALTHGAHSYLAVTASKQSVGVAMALSQPDSGNVFILDLNQLRESNGRLTATAADAFLQVDFPTREGKGPQYISSAGIKGNTLRLLLSNALDHNAGLATITVELSDLGRLQGTPTFKQIPMSGALPGMNRLDGSYQLNIQRAQSPAVIVAHKGAEYALVADYFFDFVDPLYALDEPQNGPRQMGGKIGIVRNPFGATPEYLGATSPIIDANFSRLQLTDAGKTLWADIRYWPTIGEPPPPSGLLVWDLAELIAAAERNSLARQATPRPLPIDRERVGSITTQVVAPSKLDLADSPQLTSGWIYGMAASQLLKPDRVEFTAPVDGGQFLKAAIEPDKDGKVPGINYGDIARIDLFKLIRDQYPSTLADFKDTDLNINWENIEVGGAAQLVKDTNGFVLTAERQDGFTAAEAATRESYQGLQAVNTDAGKKTLRDSGILFLAPTMDVDRLRNGERLPDGDITISIKGYDKDEPEKRLLLKLRAVDYTKAAGTVFFGDRPLNNPGYHPFEGVAGLSAKKDAENDLLDIWRVEQRLKYLGFGLSAVNTTGEITVNGAIDDAEHIALRQFEQIVEGKPEYTLTFTEKITVKGKIETTTKPLPPVTLSSDDAAWLNAYNAPHWLKFFPPGNRQLVGWDDKTDQTKPTKAMGTSWVFDLMVAAQAENETSEGVRRPNLWFAGTNDLGNRLGLGINTNYISTPNQKHVSGNEIITGVVPKTPPSTTMNAEAYNNSTWDYANSTRIAELLLNPHLSNFDAATRTFGQNPSNGTTADPEPNRQNEALLDFIVVYASTQTNGNRESITIWNGDAATIRTALFGEGNMANGIIDQKALLIGGTALSIGSQMTAKSLGKAMGNQRGVNYDDWLAPLERAMLEFDIVTPKRISAFLAQINQESGGLSNLRESFNYSQDNLASAFSYLRTHTSLDAHGNTRTLAQLLGRQTGERTVPQDRQIRIANTAYSSEANSELQNGNAESGDGWRFKGRGVKQITGRGNYQAFADYLSNHPVAGQPTGAELMRNPDLLASNRDFAARSAGWFWRLGSSASNLNKRADRLNFSKSGAERVIFDGISAGIGRKAHTERWNKYTSNVDLVQTGGNTYESLRQALSRLGFSTSGRKDYESQFGITLRPPTLQAVSTPLESRLTALVGTDLIARQSDSINSISSSALTMEIRAPRILVQPEPYFSHGGNSMAALDYVDHSASNSPIVTIAQAETRKKDRARIQRNMGICHVVPNIPSQYLHTASGTYPRQVPVFPYFEASLYFTQYEGHDIRKWYGNTGPFDRSSISIISTPAHGILLPAKCDEHRAYCEHKAFYYKPNDGYFGEDSAVIDAEVNGWKVRLNYQFHSLDTSNYRDEEVCASSGGYSIWKISQSPIDVERMDVYEWYGYNTISKMLAGGSSVPLTYQDLAGSTLGQVIGDRERTRITLDSTAAGYGWFIDLTPSDNAEFLPTSNPFEWIARPGSEAEGRMDLLTVLLHEYGHAAGLDHSADSHDLMASTLLPGVRRLPSATELIALRGLLTGTDSAPVPYDPDTPPGAPLPLSRNVGSLRLSRLRPSEPGDPTADTRKAALTQFSIVANPTLLDRAFIDGTGWSTSGEVVFVPGSATLKETASSQTRLNQAFVLGTNDRTLSFTLADIALDDLDAAPDDAFEVALIDASSGLSLLGGTGLTGSDAILNLQADGSEHTAAGVTTRRNADGSLSVIVDLTGIATGTVVNLSFDLIGFGRGAAAASSQVSIRDLHIGGGQRLEARDVVATTAEDTPVSIDVMGNDFTGDFADNPGSETDGIIPALVPILMDGPSHGDVLVNTDHHFIYSPHADWHGDDQFTYRLRGNGVESNLATVRLIVTPVNDAPTLAEISTTSALTLLEGEHFTAKASGADVDAGDTLRYSLDAAPTGAVIDPNTGAIDWRASDGDASYDFSVRVSDVAGESATRQFTLNVLNVAPTLRAGGLQATYANEDFTLELSSSDPGDDRISSWRIDWGDGQIDEINGINGINDIADTDSFGNPIHVRHHYAGLLGEVHIRATASDEDGSYTLEPLAVAVLPLPLQVSSFSYDSGGFAVRFNDAFDASQIELYDLLLTGASTTGFLRAGSAGVVNGSLIIDPDYRGLRYMIAGGGLLADTYRLTLKSGPQAFHSAWSDLDGNSDGIAGDDYQISFALDGPPATQLSLPDFMRGPGQAVDVPPAGEHLPLTLLSPGQVQHLSFIIRFDPALLEVSAVLPGIGLPADAVLTIDRSVAAELRVNIESETAIAAGTVTLLNLVASVPVTAPYGAQHILDIQQVVINAQSLAGTDRDGLHVVGYLGDADGNGSWDRADLMLIQRRSMRTHDVFAAWAQIDPRLVADVDADGLVSARDAFRIQQTMNDEAWLKLPEPPPGLPLTFAARQEWPVPPAPGQTLQQIDFGANFAGFAIGSDDPRYRRDSWKTSFVTQLASNPTVSPNSRLQVTLEASPQATPST